MLIKTYDLDDDGHDLSHDEEDDRHLHHNHLDHRHVGLEGDNGDDDGKDDSHVMRIIDVAVVGDGDHLDDAAGDAPHGGLGDVAPGVDHIHPDLGVLGPGGTMTL